VASSCMISPVISAGLTSSFPRFLRTRNAF
jgi:hypothetical protein